jgi:hypothetical protein
MIASFTDEQFALLQRIADNLPVEKRAQFLELTVAYMQQRGAYDDSVDVVEQAVNLALRTITQSAA